MTELKLPPTPFTMKEFEEANGLQGLGMKQYQLIHARLRELGLIPTRKWRGKDYPEKVWLPADQRTPATELEERLRGLRA